MYTGYLSVGGVEIANTDRVRGYLDSADCIIPSFMQEPCGTLQAALGDSTYIASNMSAAPWFDATQADVSSRFYGVSAFEIEGIHDSSRSAEVVESIGSGGVIGSARRATRRIKVKALAYAQGMDALDYGLNWLTAALSPGACGQHGGACGLADATFFTTCPPEMTTKLVPTEGAVDATNYFPNPNIIGDGTWVEVGRNIWKNSLLSDDSPSLVPTFGVTEKEQIDDGVRFNVVGEKPGQDVAYIDTFQRVPVTGGGTYSMHIPLRNPGDESVYVSLYVWSSAGVGQPNLTTTAFARRLEPGERHDVVFRGLKVHANATDLRFALWYPNNGGSRPEVGDAIDVLDGIAVWPGAADRGVATEGVTPSDDMRTRFIGTVNESDVILEIERVRGLTPSANAIAGVSSINGERAVRLIKLGEPDAQHRSASFSIPAPARGGGVLRATRHQASAFSALVPGSRATGVVYPEQSSQFHNAVGSEDLRLAYSALTDTFIASLFHGAGAGEMADVWFTDIGVFDPGYFGEVFSGDTVEPGQRPAHGYRWTGEPNNSSSERFSLEWSEEPDPEAFEPLMRQVTRYLHDAAVTSGPIVREYLGTRQRVGGLKAAEIEFTITSERGYIYAPASPVALTTVADAAEDVQRNKFLNPTTDTKGERAVLRRNLFTNPSLETSVAGWTTRGGLSDGAAATVTGGRVSGELRAVGQYSMKAQTTEHASLDTLASVSLVAAVLTGSRQVKVGIWAGLSDPSETVTKLTAEYTLNAATWVKFEELTDPADIAAARGGYSFKNPLMLTLPAGASGTLGVRVTATGRKAYALYADAAMAIEG